MWSDPDTGGNYYRANVLSVDEGRKKVKVQFIDYGNREVESFSALAQCPDEARGKRFPAMAITVKLVRSWLKPTNQAFRFCPVG
jgi:hypothetical protein